jgi:Gpi18-like mannosyltransferase
VGDGKYDIAFYPLYPILIKIVNFLFRDYFVSGFFISNILLILSLYFLYKLVTLDFEERIASNTIKYVLIFPFSFFFSIVYTESLFLFLSIMTLYFARKKSWLLAALSGMLTAFTKNQGLLLAIPLFVESIGDLNFKANLSLKNYRLIFQKLLLTISVMLLVPYGTFLYLLVNKVCYGDWFKFLQYQNENWSNKLGFFAENIRNYFMELTYRDIKLCLGVFIPNIVIFFLCAILIIYNSKKLRLSYLLYAITYLLVSFSPTCPAGPSARRWATRCHGPVTKGPSRCPR